MAAQTSIRRRRWLLLVAHAEASDLETDLHAEIEGAADRIVERRVRPILRTGDEGQPLVEQVGHAGAQFELLVHPDRAEQIPQRIGPDAGLRGRRR